MIKDTVKLGTVGDGRLRPGAATWRTGRNIRVFLFWLIRSIMGKRDVIYESGNM